MSRGEKADSLEKSIKGRPDEDLLTDHERDTVRGGATEARDMVEFLEEITADAKDIAEAMERASLVKDVRHLLALADALAVKLGRL